MNRTIEITVSPRGVTKLETKGFAGILCREASQLLEQAIADGHSSKLPIGRVLAEAEQPIDIHWAP